MKTNAEKYLSEIAERFEVIPTDLLSFIKEKKYKKYDGKGTNNFPSGISGAKINFFTTDLHNFFNDFRDSDFEKEGINRKNLIPIAKLTAGDILEHGPCILAIHALTAGNYHLYLYDSDYEFLEYTQSLEELLQKKIILEKPKWFVPELANTKYNLSDLRERRAVIPTELEEFISTGLYKESDGQPTSGLDSYFGLIGNKYSIHFFDYSLLDWFDRPDFDHFPFEKERIPRKSIIPIARLDHPNPKSRYPILLVMNVKDSTEHSTYDLRFFFYNDTGGWFSATQSSLSNVVENSLIIKPKTYNIPQLSGEKYSLENLKQRFTLLPEQLEKFVTEGLYKQYEGRKINGASYVLKGSIIYFFDRSLLDWFLSSDFDEYNWSNFTCSHGDQFRQNLIPIARIEQPKKPYPVILAIIPDADFWDGYRILELTYNVDRRSSNTSFQLSFREKMPLENFLKHDYHL